MDSIEQVIELTPEQVEELRAAEQEKALAAMRALQGRCDAYVKAAEPLRRRMIEGVRQYEGIQKGSGPTKQEPYQEGSADGPPILRATRSKTDLVEARISDMLFPTTMAQWRFDPEPEQDDEALAGLPPETLDAEVNRRVKAFEKTIRDQFAETKFPQISRKVVRDGCQLGFGLYIGPIATIKRKEKYVRNEIPVELMEGMEPVPSQVSVDVQITEENQPGVEYGDPWRFFPEPVDDLDKASGFFYYDIASEQDLRDLAEYPSARKEEIAELLKTPPDHGHVGAMITERANKTGFTETIEGRWIVWRFYGCMKQADLKAMGCECDPLQPLPMVMMRFCQGKVLLYKEAPIKGSYRIPAHVFTPFPDSCSWSGLSVPFLCRDSARAAQAAHEISLASAAASAYPWITHRPGVKPADGQWLVRGPKRMVCEDDDKELSDQFHAELFPNNVPMALDLMKLHLGFMDEDINLPQFTNPEVNKPTETAAGQDMWINAQTVVQRRSAAAFDDCMDGLLRDFVRWNKTYSDNPDLQVDVQVVPLGQSELLVKHTQIQNAIAFMNLAKSTDVGRRIDMDVVASHIAQKFELPEGAILTEEQAKEREANMPPDPVAAAEQAKAQALLQDAQLRMLKFEAEKEDKERDDAFRREDRELTHEEKQMEMMLKREQMQLEVIKLQQQKELAYLQLEAAGKVDIAKIQAMLESKVLDKQIAEYQSDMRAAIDAQKIATQRSEMAMKMSPANESGTGV